MLTSSMPEKVTDAGIAKVVSEAIFSVSVPAPPAMLSKEFRVFDAAVVEICALNVSLLAVLVVPAEPKSVPEASAPAVSGQITR